MVEKLELSDQSNGAEKYLTLLYALSTTKGKEKMATHPTTKSMAEKQAMHTAIDLRLLDIAGAIN